LRLGVIARVASVVALLSGLASAQPVVTDTVDEPQPKPTAAKHDDGPDDDGPDDDLLHARQLLRPITRDRLEAIVDAGTEGARDVQTRGTATAHGVGFELTGDVHDSDLRDRKSATARVESEHAKAYGGYATQHQDTDDARVAHYGADWQHGRFQAHAFGDTQRLDEERLGRRYEIPTSSLGANASVRSGRLYLLGMSHELVIGANFERTSGTTTTEDTAAESTSMPMAMTRRSRHGDHRFLEAYMNDTLHVIESLDLSGGFIIEDWRSLSAIETIHYGVEQNMDVHFPDVSDMQFSPQVGALYRVDDHLSVRANGYRRMRAPSLTELYQPIALDGTLTAANPALRPESTWGAEVGPALDAGKIEARAVAFYNIVESPITSVATADGMRERTNLGGARVTGIETEASWRPAKPWLATVSYTFANSVVTDPGFAGKRLAQMPRHRASAMLTYDNPRVVTVTGGMRYIDGQYIDASNTASLAAFTLIDAMAARKIKRGIAGFVGVENLLDRRYIGQYGIDTQGAPRTFRVGVRIDSARF
jgi:outer membrane receptor protein involved in Fe transport